MIKLFCDGCEAEIKENSNSVSQFTYHDIVVDMTATSTAPRYEAVNAQLCTKCTKMMKEGLEKIKKGRKIVAHHI